MARAGAQVLKLAVEEEDIAGLRDDNALSGQLLLQADGAEIGANAHGPGGVESNEGVSRSVPDGDSLRLDHGSVNVQHEFVFDAHANRAGVESDRQRASSFEDR